jgi:hypothetical protein
MADMSPITTTIDGASYTFKLLESDIATLTFSDPTGNTPAFNPTRIAYQSLLIAAGIDFGPSIGNGPSIVREKPDSNAVTRLANSVPGLFDQWSSYAVGSALSPKTQIALAGAALINRFNLNIVKATLVISLKGGGLSLQAAANTADQLSRSCQSQGARPYVGQVLVPQILAAAAAA